MKESAAKEKWCPMIRFGPSVCNTDSQTPVQRVIAPFYRCIGSDCMMWEQEGKIIQGRWVSSEYGDCGLKSKELN